MFDFWQIQSSIALQISGLPVGHKKMPNQKTLNYKQTISRNQKAAPKILSLTLNILNIHIQSLLKEIRSWQTQLNMKVKLCPKITTPIYQHQ